MSDSWSPVFNIIEKKNSRFDEADLQTIREHASSLSGYAGNRANVLNGRLAVELLDVNTCLIDAVTKLDASSTRLVSTTNRLTTAILWLTALTAGLAAVQVGIAAFTWWKTG